jgi:hypothetical protein
MFADQPGFVARQMVLAFIPDPLRWSIGGTDADSGKAGFELAFRPASPAHRLPLGPCTAMPTQTKRLQTWSIQQVLLPKRVS